MNLNVKDIEKQILKPFHPRKAYDGEESQGVELKDYLNFYQVASSLKLYLAFCCSKVLYSINDIDTALTFYHVAGAPIDRKTMQHVARFSSSHDLKPPS